VAGREGALGEVASAWAALVALAVAWAAADAAAAGGGAVGKDPGYAAGGEAGGVVDELLTAGPGRALRRALRGVAEIFV